MEEAPATAANPLPLRPVEIKRPLSSDEGGIVKENWKQIFIF
jgi:hypothetical protein